MSPEIPGIAGTPRPSRTTALGPAVTPGTVPVEPAGRITPPTALAPVSPTGTRRPSVTPSPLGRSGLDLLEVFGTSDLLVERRTVAPVELDVGLESARGSLVRGLATESLATLDGIWERAQLTEEAWYLRSGALTVLGLPGEADRVCTAALQLKPSSVALRFLQSLARLAGGDLSGARGALAAALDQQATHPVMLMQHIVVVARQGNRDEAERLLQQGARLHPDHPALEFARSSLREIAADETRRTSRSAFGGRLHEPDPFTTGDHEVFEAFGAASRGTAFNGGDRIGENTPGDHGAAWNDTCLSPGAMFGNVAERAMARLGASFATLSVPDVVREARMLIRAFSAGGSMAGASTPEQAHAARGLLTAIVFALANGASAAHVADGLSPLDALLAQWMPRMQAQRFDDAGRVLRRLGRSIPDAQRRLLEACTPLADQTSSRDDRTSRMMPFVSGEYEAFVQGEPAKGPLIPVRLGLALLEERLAERHRSGWVEHPRGLTPSQGAPSQATPRHGMASRVTPLGGSGAAIEVDGRGWATALAAGAYLPPTRDEGAGMRIAALLCVIIAAGAAMGGSGVLAIAFGVGAAWLGLRRSGRTSERFSAHAAGMSDRDTTEND